MAYLDDRHRLLLQPDWSHSISYGNWRSGCFEIDFRIYIRTFSCLNHDVAVQGHGERRQKQLVQIE
jgi:hypothetical protein